MRIIAEWARLPQTPFMIIAMGATCILHAKWAMQSRFKRNLCRPSGTLI